MRRYQYILTINGTPWDITKICDSSTLSVVAPLCSTEKKSGNGTASVNIKGGANTAFYQSLMTALLSAQANRVIGDCELVITDWQENKVIHRGYLNMDELTISSTNIPDALNLASKDKMQFLDTKIRWNILWEDTLSNNSRNNIVEELVNAMNTDTGIVVPFLSSELSPSSIVHNYCVAEGKNETYRDVIDKVLFEAVGYVLWYDYEADGFRIKQIPTNYDPLNYTYRVVQYRVENKLITQSAVYPNDGILLSYPTVETRPNTNIYNDDISLTVDDDNVVTGVEVASGDYYPTDGDVKEIFQEYSMPDRPFISHESRLQNKDLSLLYAKDVSYQLASKPPLVLAPALPNVDWDGTAKFYPDRARILFKNSNANPSNVTTFSVTGTAVYISAMNKVTVPNLCTKPEEYTADTIQWLSSADEADAKAFADWLYNTKRYGCTTSRWAEPEGYSTLGEIVLVRHKDTGVEMPHVIVQITDTCAGGRSGLIRLKEVVAISLYGWQSALTQSVTSTNKPSTNKPQNTRWISGTVLTGKPNARGVAGNVGDYYLNTATGDIYKCIIAGTDTTALWEWVMNNKGEDADISGLSTVIEFGLSTSPDQCIFPDGNLGYDEEKDYGAIDSNLEEFELGFKDVGGWSTSYDRWYRGLYVWSRTKTTDADGNVSYSDPTYCKDITQSLYDGCKFEIVPDSPTWDRNYASLGDTSVGFTFFATNFRDDAVFAQSIKSVTFKAYKGNYLRNTSTIEYPNVLHYAHTFPTASDWDRIEVSAVLEVNIDEYYTQTQNASCSISANDITQYDVYGGKFATEANADTWFNDNCGGALVGYSFIDTTLNVIKIRRPIDASDKYGIWSILDITDLFDADKAGIVLTQCEVDLWTLYENMTDAQQEEAWKNYGYKKQIIAKAIATAKLIMYAEGIIASQGIPTTPSAGLDADGFLENDGYRLEGGLSRVENGKNVGATVRATNGYFKNGKFKGGNFDNITVNRSSTFHGSIDTDVFKTVLDNESGNECTATSPNWEYGEADGVLGSEVKSNLHSILMHLLGDSHQASANTINLDIHNLTNVNLNGNTGANKVMRFSTVRTAVMAIKTQQVASATVQETISWVNPYPVNIKVNPNITANRVTYDIPYTTISWSATDNGRNIGSYPVQTSRPDNPSDGETWISYYDISPWGSGGRYYEYSWTEYTANVTTSYNSYSKDGTYTVRIDGVTQSVKSSYDIPSGSTFSVLFGVPNPPYDAEDEEYYKGQLVINWIEADNFKAGFLFVKNASRSASFYLADLSNDVWTTDTTITLPDDNEAVSLPLGVYGHWSFDWDAGFINKLFRFAWDVGFEPIGSGKYTAFSGHPSMSLVKKDGSSVSESNAFNWVDYTATTASINYNDGNGNPQTVSFSSTDYYRSFSIDFTPLTVLKGINGMSITPMADQTYDLGTDQKKWNNIRGYHIYSNNTELTSSRKVKEGIETWDKSALDILAQVDIKSFYFKTDRDSKDRYRHIGFIAEDTPVELATPKQNSMDVGSCIGVLIKAVQELSAQNKALTERLEKLGGK